MNTTKRPWQLPWLFCCCEENGSHTGGTVVCQHAGGRVVDVAARPCLVGHPEIHDGTALVVVILLEDLPVEQALLGKGHAVGRVVGPAQLELFVGVSRMSFQEFFEVEEGQEPSGLVKVLTNKYVSTIISLVCGYLLSLGGYVNIWPLFGSANQLLAAMVLISLAVFLKVTGRKGFMLYIPMVLMFIVTMTALVQAIYGIVMKLFVTGGFVLMVDGLQLVVAILLVALGLMIGFNSGSKLVKEK